jgi:hypothetical protein
VVKSIEPVAVEAKKPAKRTTAPPAMRMLVSVVREAIAESELPPIRPYLDGSLIKAAPEDFIKHRYYQREALKAEDGEDPAKLADRQRKNFKNAIADAIKREILAADRRRGALFVAKGELNTS